MNGIRLVVLSDNRPGQSGLDTEHGLSTYMEGPSGRFLLDTGASDLFARNAEKLGIDLRKVDYCLISHGHHDHIGIMNILHSVQESVTCCIGGFHLLDSDGEKEYETDDELRQIAKELRSEYLETAFYTGHCTGDQSFQTLSDAMQDQLHQFHCGERLTITA